MLIISFIYCLSCLRELLSEEESFSRFKIAD
jgi:hypothetical protein